MAVFRFPISYIGLSSSKLVEFLITPETVFQFLSVRILEIS